MSPAPGSDPPSLDAWNAWTPAELHARFAELTVPWCVVGGWAIDLAAGRVTREHGDFEIAILRQDFALVRRALAEFEFFTAGDGEVQRLLPGSWPPEEHQQNWVLDPATDEWRVDVMLEGGSADEWLYRRDPTIRAARATMVARSPDEIPYLRPHGVLLFKAKYVRPKDDADFVVAEPLLTDSERAWLVTTLDRTHPGHPWSRRLSGSYVPKMGAVHCQMQCNVLC